ncbi:MAG: ATP-binding cassette domain-containing protein, partial [Treponema sp.]|nr:ATP-binding cassette domain-containing protein [Treponema sp.]
MENDLILSMRNISKEFPGVKALTNVDFSLRKGEIRALMGENGAGKSTLIKVLTGVYHKDSGQINIDGINKPVTIKSPQEAQNMGISTVYQEITLCPNITVAENLFIGRGKYSFINWRIMEKKAKELLNSLFIPAKPNQQLSSCSLAVQQMVAIARAVDMECKVLILDEPTSSLDEQEVAKLFSLMHDLQARGVGIIFVTHFLEQVYKVCDTITVLRNGELVGNYTTKDLPRVELIAKMMGKAIGDLSELRKKDALSYGAGSLPFYEVTGLSSSAGVKPYNIKVYKG